MQKKVLLVAVTLPFLASAYSQIEAHEDHMIDSPTTPPPEDDFYRLFFNALQPQGEHVAHPFVPKHTRCCKAGEQAAKKSLSCSGQFYDRSVISDPYQNHKLNLGQAHGLTTSVIRKIAYQASVCFETDFAANFKKCCQWRTDYLSEKLDCRVLKRGYDRKNCRKAVREKYSAYM